jgi:hypothetical protein
MKNAVFWDVTLCGSVRTLQEPHSLTSQKTTFFYKHKLDLVGLQEVRWEGGCTKLAGEYVFL